MFCKIGYFRYFEFAKGVRVIMNVGTLIVLF